MKLTSLAFTSLAFALVACGGTSASTNSGASNDGGSGNPPSLPTGTWTQSTSPTGGDLGGIWGSAANDVWAVGENGIIHYDGSAWSTSPSNDIYMLSTAVWGSSAKDVYVVGMTPGESEYASTINHWDGSTWTLVPGTIPGNDLYAVWGSSATDIWAAGDYANGSGLNGQLLHFDGKTWTQAHTEASTTTFDGVWGSSATDVYAASTDGGVFHFDGTNWSKVASVGTSSTRFGRVAGTSEKDVWITADGDIGGPGEIFHFDGSSWTMTYTSKTNSFDGVWCADDASVWAVGSLTDPSALRAEGEIAFGNASGFGLTVPQTSPATLNAVWGSAPNDVWIVGDGGAILHYH
jgi:hypothetical protein